MDSNILVDSIESEKHVAECILDSDDSSTEKEDLDQQDCLSDATEEGHEDDDDSGDEQFGQVALAFDESQLSAGDGFPQNGHDYLRLVQNERRNFPQVATDKSLLTPSDKNNSGDKMEQTIPSKRDTNDEDTSYRCQVLENFKQLRLRIGKIREACNNKVDDSKCIHLLGTLPQTKELIPCSQSKLHQTLEECARQVEDMNDMYSTSVISYSRPVYHFMVWMYALMASLRDPLEADIYSTLRRIARLCIASRNDYSKVGPKEQEEGEEEYVMYLLIICIVRHFFGQEDLN